MNHRKPLSSDQWTSLACSSIGGFIGWILSWYGYTKWQQLYSGLLLLAMIGAMYAVYSDTRAAAWWNRLLDHLRARF